MNIKFAAQDDVSKSRHFAIERDDGGGFYLHVFDDDCCIGDYLQDTIELVIQQAFDDFGVPKESWKQVDN